MKNLLYIGNMLSQTGKTVTTIETLSVALLAEGFQVTSVSRQSNKVLRLLEMLFAILKATGKTDYVLIDTYSTQNFYYAYLCSQLCRFLNLKYIPILHGGNLPNRLKNNPKLSTAIFKNAHINIAPSNYTKSHFEAFGFHNIKIIPNAITIDTYAFEERQFEKVKLLWVRSFSKIYHPQLAVDVLYGLRKKGVNATLCMVGPDNDGSLEKTKHYAFSLGVDVTFTGKLSKIEWITLAKNYTYFINTTNFDNMPVSVIEAMALGLPVISTQVGGLPYLIDDRKTGILVEPNNATAFIEAIMELKNNPKETNKLVINAKREVQRFDWNSVKTLWISVLK
ncbi:glycosyltransferase family 4 protein [Lacinutrix neustonica]|uniref:Glycosyltransferase family 4 protein n=1 Tax=Lacinutrix neustonica TaxID=2980107 RepID=A0A9E8MX95_9FLAO|nr:glycosyltransferase family 4 protein [Lacinutrix neustonica]WAC01964.1 glycosyltransferase family 4 protein [Lacinutrix neustonica]